MGLVTWLETDELLAAALRDDIGVDNRLLQYLTRAAIRVYFIGKYDNVSACELAALLKDQRVVLLSGKDAGYLRDSTNALRPCFQGTTLVEAKTDLPLTGYNLTAATGEQGEGYDRQVIDFFDRNLR